MKNIKIIFYLLLLCTASAFAMEEKIQPPKSKSSALVSFLEARMAGGYFCVDAEEQTVTFKHYKKEKKFSFLFSDLPTVESVILEELPQENTKDHFYKEYGVLPSQDKRYIKERILREQLERFNEYKNDPLYILYKYRKFIIEREQQLLALEKSAQQHDIRYSPGHIKFFALLKEITAHNKENPKRPDQRNFKQSVIERHRLALASELESINNNLEFIGEHYKNRMAMEEALIDKDLEKFDKASWKKTQLSYEPLRDIVPKMLPECFKKISACISFFDAVFGGGKFEIIEDGLQFQHFKKNKKIFHINPHTPPPFNREYFGDILTFLIQSIHINKSHNDYLLLLSLLTPNQKKAVIFFKEVLSQTVGPRTPFQSKNKEDLLKELKKMDTYEKMHLDGFDISKQDDPVYCDTYVNKLVEIIANFNDINAVKIDDLENYVAVCKKPFTIAYIPFQERLKQREEEISQLRK